MFEGEDDELEDPDGLSTRIKELISKNEGNTALLSENKRLATEVEVMKKEVDRLNSEQMVLMQRVRGCEVECGAHGEGVRDR